jgi:thymidylate kinase
VRNLYSFALRPDAIFYLRISVDDLIPRVVFSRGFDYWECGKDLYPSEDMYEAFRKYQTALLAQFDKLAEEDGFEVIDATPDVHTVFRRLQEGISRVLSGEPHPPLFASDAHAPGEKPREKQSRPPAHASVKEAEQEASR